MTIHLIQLKTWEEVCDAVQRGEVLMDNRSQKVHGPPTRPDMVDIKQTWEHCRTQVAPWKLTFAEFKSLAGRTYFLTDEDVLVSSTDELYLRYIWGASVDNAAARGEDIPASVRKDRPELKQQAANRAKNPVAEACEVFIEPVVKAMKEYNTAKEATPMATPSVILNAKGKPFSWSTTAIQDFETCGVQYDAKRFSCTEVFQETEAMRWGTEVHKALELRLKDQKPLPEGMTKWEKYAKAIEKQAVGGQLILEEQMAINRKLQMVSWFAKDAWGRGAADVIVLKDDTVTVLDWKTGKQKDSPFQIQVYFAFLALKFPQVQKFEGRCVWLKDDKIGEKYTATRADIKGIWQDILRRVAAMEEAWRTQGV